MTKLSTCLFLNNLRIFFIVGETAKKVFDVSNKNKNTLKYIIKILSLNNFLNVINYSW